jgi:lipoprotein-releasing system permease protein
MKIRASLFLASRYLFSPLGGPVRRIRGAVLAVSLSLIPLIVVLEISEGMIQGITARYLELGTYHLQAVSFDDIRNDELDEILNRILSRPGVSLAVSERQGLGLAYSRTGRTGATIRAVPETLWMQDEGMRRYLKVLEGSFDLFTPDSAVLGSELAGRLGVKVGDSVKILTTRGFSGDSFIPRVSTFIVRGIVSTGYQELDKLWVYIPLERGNRILSRETSRSILGIKVENPFGDLGPLVESLYSGLPPGFRIYTWYEIERAQFMSFRTTKYLLLFIMALIICVASVNISSALVMLQIEKRDELAILKSLGLGPGDIYLIFQCVGFVVGCLGTFLGTAGGLGISLYINEIIVLVETGLNAAADIAGIFLNPFGTASGEPIRIFNPQFYLEYIPITIHPGEILGAACFSLFISLLSSYLPSRAAAGIRPIEVLRKH